MHAFRHVLGHVAHHGGLDRARVGEDRAGRQMSRDFGRERPEAADRRAQDRQIRAPDGIGGMLVYLVGKAEPAHGFARRRRARGRGNPARKACPPRRVGDGGADQADADQRNFLKHGLRHGEAC